MCCDTQLFKDRSNFLVCLRTLAAAVWTSCSCLSDFFLRPVKTQLKPSRLLKINDSTNYFHIWLRQESCRSCSALKGEGGLFHFKWMLNESAHLQLWCVDFCIGLWVSDLLILIYCLVINNNSSSWQRPGFFKLMIHVSESRESVVFRFHKTNFWRKTLIIEQYQVLCYQHVKTQQQKSFQHISLDSCNNTLDLLGFII